jgi:hypothetical protein
MGPYLVYHLIGPLVPIMPSTKGLTLDVQRFQKEQSLEIPFSPPTPPDHPPRPWDFLNAQ